MKIDMHIHSKSSSRPSKWILQKINCPESFTEPLMIYHLAKERGMSHVTITDHNDITGALKIAHLPNTFISEEITTYFPEDGCKVHILAYQINEAHHEVIQKLRSNIYELAAYLRTENIFHAVAHPLYSVNNKLLGMHFEKMLVMFKVFEQNGARSSELNQCMETILKHLTCEDIELLANKHGLTPFDKTPWKKQFIAGSDDHSSLNIARSFTELEDAKSLDNFISGIKEGRANVFCTEADPKTLAHNLYGIAYQFYYNKFNLDRSLGKDPLLIFLNKTLQTGIKNGGRMPKLTFFSRYRNRPRKINKIPDTLKTVIHKETLKLILNDKKMLKLIEGHDNNEKPLEEYWFDFVNQVTNNATHHLGNHILEQLFNVNIFGIFQSIGNVGGLYLLLSPYFIAFKQFSEDKRTKKEIIQQFPNIAKKAGLANTQIKIAHFTDTFDEINGVALTLKQQVQEARENNFDYTLITCNGKTSEKQTEVMAFAPVGSYSLPEYPEFIVNFPPILEIMGYCYSNNITHIISATPGPMGIAAWIIAKTLNLCLSGTYHTAIPQYVQLLTGDSNMAESSWKYIIWYYDQMDRIHAPSESTKKELIEKGIAGEKIDLMHRGINIDRFHPKYKNGILKSRFLIPDNAVKLLYVGRVSKEKNLDLLADVFTSLCAEYDNLYMVVSGDGPYLSEMKARLKKYPCTFTGYLEGEDLSCVYASSDIFVFPSTTDTFGNVVLEAQASGIPVIVSNKGGPCENIICGETGFVSADDHEAFRHHIKKLIDQPENKLKMGLAARKYMETRSFGSAFLKTWEQFEESSRENRNDFTFVNEIVKQSAVL